MQIILGNNLAAQFRNYFNALAEKPDAGFSLLPANISKYRSNEPNAKLLQSPAGQDVVLIQSTAGAVSESCMQIFLTAASLKRNGAKSVTVAMPFAAFARQDKLTPGEAGSLAAEDFPKLLKAAGVDKVITSEVHSKAAEKYYTDAFGVENVTFLYNIDLFAQDIATHFGDSAVEGAPDGADKPHDAAQIRAHEVAARVHGKAAGDPALENHMFKIWKTHTGVNDTKVLKFEGNVAGRHAAIIDDMTDSCGTLCNAADVLKANGASGVTAYVSHALFDLDALRRFRASAINTMVVSDSVPGVEDKIASLKEECPDLASRIRILSSAPSYARALGLTG